MHHNKIVLNLSLTSNDLHLEDCTIAQDTAQDTAQEHISVLCNITSKSPRAQSFEPKEGLKIAC